MKDKRIHVGDRVRLAPDAPMADKGLGQAGVIVLDGMTERWDTVHVSDNGSVSAEMRGHLVKAEGGGTRGQ